MSGGGSASVMYFHDSERHREQIAMVAREFVPYRRIVDPGVVLSFTALESTDDRHGVGHIARSWADQREDGVLTESEYIQKVADTYETR